MKEIVNILIKNNKTISTMESCTGGYVANEITNIENSSKVLKFSAVTYSNEYKIKMGVDSDIIDKYTVYSMEVADCMAKAISNFTNSDYGIGITGKLKKSDDNNPFNEDDIVYISIYDKNKDKHNNKKVKVTKDKRSDNKKIVYEAITCLLKEILL